MGARLYGRSPDQSRRRCGSPSAGAQLLRALPPAFPAVIPKDEASRGLLHPALFPDVRDGLSEASKHSFMAIIETPPVRASVRTPCIMDERRVRVSLWERRVSLWERQVSLWERRVSPVPPPLSHTK